MILYGAKFNIEPGHRATITLMVNGEEWSWCSASHHQMPALALAEAMYYLERDYLQKRRPFDNGYPFENTQGDKR